MSAKSFLDRLSQLTDLDDIDTDLVQSIPWSSVTVKRGSDILSLGDRPNYVYVIESGWAARYTVRRNGTRRVTGFMLPGDFCGIHAVTGEAMEHAIIALTECEVARVQASIIEEAIAVSPAIGKALWRAKLTDEAILRMWLLNSQDAETALAHLICELHARAEAIGAVHDNRFLVPVIQEQLGDALGITAVHANRMMKQLRLSGLVHFEGHVIFIPDIDALRSACSFSAAYLHLPECGLRPALAA